MIKKRLRRFLVLHRYLLPYLDKQILIYLCALGFMSFGLATPYLSRMLVDYGLLRQDREVFLAIILCGIVLFVFSSIIGVIQGYLSFFVSVRLGFDLRSDYYGTVLNKTVGFFENRTTGELLYRMTADTGGVVGLVTGTIPGLLLMLIRFAFILAICLWLSWKATLMVLVALPLAYLLNHYFGKMGYALNKQLNEKGQAVSSDIQDSLSRVLLFKAYGRENFAVNSYRRAAIAQIRVMVKNFWLGVAGGQSSQYINHVFGLGVTVFLGLKVLSGAMTLGSYIALSIYLMQLYGILKSFGGAYQGFLGQFVFVDRYFEVVDEASIGRRRPVAQARKSPAKGAAPGLDVMGLEVRDLTLGYGEKPLLDGISFKAAPGRAVAITGGSGVGKTTLAALLAGLHQPWKGSIAVDGQDIWTMDAGQRRKAVALALQEPLLLNRSLLENLLFVSGKSQDQTVEKALAAAELDSLVQNHPAGKNLPVGQGGQMLSRGQAQRVGLAMSLMKKARVLILDEATNQVEPEIEGRIIANVRALFPEACLVMLSCRPGIAAYADDVFELTGGRLAPVQSQEGQGGGP
ncbi:MAG: ABC transporter ATP-binding protein [Desulfatibacillaceae bacterium]|nr:ABC transporter ATP-binding protein [Desulfatibacillaceae bacterium]